MNARPVSSRLAAALVWTAALILWGATAARAGDWPRWGGTDSCNMVSAERHLPATFVPGEKSPQGTGIDMATTHNVKWVARLGSQTYGTPTVANGRIYVGTNDTFLDDPRFTSCRGGLVKCFEEATGKLLWQLPIPKFETSDKNFNYDNIDLGTCASLTVEGNRAYLVSNRGEVLCLDTQGMANGNDGPYTDEGRFMVPSAKPPVAVGPHDGDVVWRYDMIKGLPCWPQDASNCSPMIHGDLLYACTSNGVDKSHDHVPLPLCPSLIALDKHTGRLVAQDAEKIGTRLFHGQWSSPSLGVVGGRALIFWGGGDGVCYAFAALDKVPQQRVDLTKVWSYDCNPPEYKFHDGKPIYYRDGDMRRKKGNTGDGTFVGPSEIIASPVFYNNRVYVATGQDPAHGRGRGILNCIDATKTGDITHTGKVWSYDKIDRTISNVSIAGGLLFIADVAGNLHCLDPDTGHCHWVHATKAEVWGSTLVADGKVYLGTKKSLWVFAADKELKIIGEIHLGTPALCTPVAANGVLYVPTHKYLYAVTEKDDRPATVPSTTHQVQAPAPGHKPGATE